MLRVKGVKRVRGVRGWVGPGEECGALMQTWQSIL